MAKVKMMYVNIFAMQSKRRQILKQVQKFSVMDIKTATLDEETNKCPEDFHFPNKASEIQAFERNVPIINQALSAIEEFFPEKKSMLASLSGRAIVEDDDFKNMSKDFLSVIQKCHEIINLQKEIQQVRANKVKIRLMIEQLVPWQSLDLALSFAGTNKTKAFIGSFPEELSAEQIEENFLSHIEFPVEFEIINSSIGMTCVVFVCLNENAKEMEKLLRENAFARPPISSSKTPKEKTKQYKEKIEDLEISEKSCMDRLGQFAHSREEIELCYDYIMARIKRYEAIEHMPHSKSTFILRGYVPYNYADDLKKVLEENFGAYVEIEDANEDLQPVILKNNYFARPSEGLTQMYALPSKSDIDPTFIMSCFYYLFFGIMLSDIGYGLIMAIGSWALIKKFKPEPKMERNLRLFIYCGISTVIWGFMFGSFFGDSLPVLSEFFTGQQIALQPILFNPTEQATTFLIMSIALGFIQIMVGLGAKFYILWRDKKRLEAIFSIGFWMTLLLGLAVLALSVTGIEICLTIGAIVSIASVLGIMVGAGIKSKGVMRFFAGFGELYGITGYVSDLMSYSRLMALGLTTGAMGAVFNMLSAMFGKNIVGILCMIIIFVFGHAINFGLNALGSYVHTLRLQYVELFSKFYDGGGREFQPFSLDGKYVRIYNKK